MQWAIYFRFSKHHLCIRVLQRNRTNRIYLSIYLSVYPSIYLPTYLPTYISVGLAKKFSVTSYGKTCMNFLASPIPIYWRVDLLQKLVQAVMEAKKFLDLWSIGWRIRTAVQVQRSEDRGADGISPNLSPKAWEPGMPMSEASRRWKSPLKQRVCPSSSFLFYSGPQQIGWCPPTLGRTTCFTQFTNSTANLFWKHSHRHIQIKCFTSCLGIP